jgi:outer membrane protein assembly factor BamB
VHALDAATGSERWRFETGDVLHHTPTVAGGRVFVSNGRDQLAALALGDGAKQWETNAMADDTRPVVVPEQGLVLVGNSFGLEAFCTNSGDRVWRLVTSTQDTPEEDYLGVISEPVVTNDHIYVQTHDTSPFAIGDVGNMYGLDPATGAVQWQFAAERPASRLIGAGGVAILRQAPAGQAPAPGETETPTDAELIGVNIDGNIVWRLSEPWKPMAVGMERLLVYRGDRASLDGEVTIGCLPLSEQRPLSPGRMSLLQARV